MRHILRFPIVEVMTALLSTLALFALLSWVHRAAMVIGKARQIILDFRHDIVRMTVLSTLRTRLRYPRGSPC